MKCSVVTLALVTEGNQWDYKLTSGHQLESMYNISDTEICMFSNALDKEKQLAEDFEDWFVLLFSCKMWIVLIIEYQHCLLYKP